MKILEILFALIAHFVPLPEGRLKKLTDESGAWYIAKVGDHTTSGDGSKLAEFLKKSEAWYWQVAGAIAYLIGLKSIASWLTSTDTDNDDEDDKPLFNPHTGRINI
jgi:hypothetical protein